MHEIHQYFEKRFFYKQVLDFTRPCKILCHTSNDEIFVKISGPHSAPHPMWKGILDMQLVNTSVAFTVPYRRRSPNFQRSQRIGTLVLTFYGASHVPEKVPEKLFISNNIFFQTNNKLKTLLKFLNW
jgi:hypothetical protein